MPGGDRTGPTGRGPMTGRAAGYCAGYGMPGYMNPSGGRFFGRGFWGGGRGGGRGRGWRNRFYATGQPGWARSGWVPAWEYPPYPMYGGPDMSREQELEMLKAQADEFRQALDEIQKHIKEVESEAKKK